MEPHVFEATDDDGRRITFACPVPGCGRRVLVDRRLGTYLVVDRGDFFAPHRGAVGPLALGLGPG